VVVSSSQTNIIPRYWPSARYFTEAIQCPSVCFSHPLLRGTLPAVDRLGMPLVTSGQFAYVYKLKSTNGNGDFAVRCFRGYLGDRDQRYRAIQEHLHSSPVSYLSDFTYATEGILVGGNRFPVLFMKWIEGPTLDLYIGEMLTRPDVLLHLSEEWLRLLSALQTSGIAHGDLQHGNIIVEHGKLRLVDHDGIFATKMSGWTASEIGHQHYQHPHRTAQHFDAKLDNFSSLVIYLSLLSLAERPGLWEEHHDENLIFTKTDFADPVSSDLFKKIRELGPEHSRLADVLAEAAIGAPTNVPSLLDLVTTKSNLPTWMTAPVNLDATTKTREVIPAELPSERKTVRWIPWQEKARGSSLPSTPASDMVQSVFSASRVPAPGPTVSVKNPDDILQNTLTFSREFMRRYFLIWYWGIYILLGFIGLDRLLAAFTGLICMIVGCLTFGLVRALEEARRAKTPNLLSVSQTPIISLPPDPQPHFPSPWNAQVGTPPTVPTVTASDPFVGNVVLGIYHRDNCSWVDSISLKNRVGFSTTSEALSHGYKPCRICSP
jgi:serine/threonine protein kinase